MTISGILQAAIFIAFFLVFINGEIGWLLVYTLLAALLISFALWFVSRKAFTVSVEEFSGIADVGRECTVIVNLRKDGFCFLPCIKVMGSAGGRPFELNTSLLFRKEAAVEITFRPESCGLLRIKLSQASAQDFFGTFRRRSVLDDCSAIAVMPRRVEYVGPEVVPSLLPSENEEREEGVAVSFGGTAGYEHRDYVQGDSLRRVNYKLSAKKRRLMVRLDESGGTESTNILLTSDADGDCAEQALALADRLVPSGSPVNVYHKGEVFFVAAPPSVDKLREWLAFRELGGEYLADDMPSGSVCVVISPQGIKVK